ncbi:MAG: cation transporter [Acidobacteria bacterium]|nr:cation transporter [Acidobacteriota bacterium]
MSAPPGVSTEAETREARLFQKRQLTLVIVLTAVILVVEVVGGVLSGSLALLSDAGHMLTDLLALVLSLMAVGFASLPATQKKTYGYHRIEILTALLNGSFLILISAGILYKAFQRLLEPVTVATGLMSGVALLGLLGNLLAIAILSRASQSLNIRGARMHVVGDALSSFGVLAAGLAIGLTGWQAIDPIVGAVIAVVIVIGAIRLVREAVDVLLEAAPAGIDLEKVSEAIAAVPGVLEVHDLHVWSITTGLPALSGHVRIDGARGATSDEMLNRIKQDVRDRFGIVHTTIQIESRAYQELGDVH